MLFWLFIIILIIGIGLVILSKKMDDYYYKRDAKEKLKEICANDDIVRGIGIASISISSIVLVIMILVLCCSYIGVDAYIEEKKETYKAIEYKFTSDACDDKFGLISKTVIDEVQNWNEYIKYRQKIQDDFWIGIFYPNIYDQFETINYENYNTNWKQNLTR
jgi:hypothetical protein